RAEQVLSAFAREPNSPTLQALHEGISAKPLADAHYVVPFSSARKWSAMAVQDEDWIMGAPEMVWPNGEDEICQSINEIAQNGKRVLILLKAGAKPGPDALPKDRYPVGIIV